MSTFNGLIAEFPDIRVDNFRQNANANPPLACFLSHIHSDHLAGLESLRSPFVYCSAATREMLLRLERFPCRINYAKGILEARVQTYKHLKNLLKPIPLETPTVLELAPGHHLQVTLFDANHCPGAVMFLFEGSGKAALYTGDIRSEPWFVNAIARSPCLIEYTSGLKTIDTVYLDTSFIDDFTIPSKAEGIAELLKKAARYPKDTIFHFQAWTYGYEDVWIALSKSLDSKIHVDDYKMSIYRSLIARDPAARFGTQYYLSPEAARLMGFTCGNVFHPGCLTLDENCRLHSCEKGNYCEKVLRSPVVRIKPVVSRLPGGQEILELGVGGGGDDLSREVELDIPPAEMDRLLTILCDDDALSDDVKEQVRAVLTDASDSGRKILLGLESTGSGESGETTLAKVFEALAKKSQTGRDNPIAQSDYQEVLPSVITFPYSRHSSYPELCHLLDVLKPGDLWPCTVSPREWFEKGVSIQNLFGKFCSGQGFRHDELMEQARRELVSYRNDEETQNTTISSASSAPVALAQSPAALQGDPELLPEVVEVRLDDTDPHSQEDLPEAAQSQVVSIQDQDSDQYDDVFMQDSQDSSISEYALEIRHNAFHAILQNIATNAGHQICLLSTRGNHSTLEIDLGEQ